MPIATDRPPRRLALRVPDSGRTWLVMYDKIRQIPPSSLELGDVLIVRHPTEPGVMVMQVCAPRGNAWHLEQLQFADPN